jgi:hypothetical protein
MISVFHGYSLLVCVFVRNEDSFRYRTGSAVFYCSNHFILTLTNGKRYTKMSPAKNQVKTHDTAVTVVETTAAAVFQVTSLGILCSRSEQRRPAGFCGLFFRIASDLQKSPVRFRLSENTSGSRSKERRVSKQ